VYSVVSPDNVRQAKAGRATTTIYGEGNQKSEAPSGFSPFSWAACGKAQKCEKLVEEGEIQMTTYSFLNDFVFKYAFGREKNEHLLICLLNALLKLESRDKIETLQILNPFNLKEFADSKLSIVDVKAVDGWNRRYNIEVQVNPQSFFIPRALYYLGKLYCEQIGEGQPFSHLQKATGISILEFTIFPHTAELQNVFRFRNLRSGEDLTEALELHFIELPKFDKEKPRLLHSPFERWLHVLKFGALYPAGEKLPAELKREEGIPMALEELRKVNADREMRQLIEAREKARHDEATRFAEAELRGKVLGLAEGIEKGRREGIEKGRQEGIERGRQEGIERGRQEGIERGRQEGIERGRQEGIERGRQEGIEKGHEERSIQLIRKLSEKGHSPEEIAELLDRPLPEVLDMMAVIAKTRHGNTVSEPKVPFGKKVSRKR
jgi:predicted transposase/invertase (TIGR01784 family)